MSSSPPGKIRIVAGSHRGRRLKVAMGLDVRPTAERVREAVFDALGAVEGLYVLDLFAGTGAMGLEALSRGASKCVFVESNPMIAGVLRENISALKLDAMCRVVVSSYEKGLAHFVKREERFDLLFVDPPYRMLAEVEVTLRPLITSLLKDDGVMVVEGEKSSHVEIGQPPVFDRTYGDTRVSMIRLKRSIP